MLASYADIRWAPNLPHPLMSAETKAANFGPREVPQTLVWLFHSYMDIKSVSLNTPLARNCKVFNTGRKNNKHVLS